MKYRVVDHVNSISNDYCIEVQKRNWLDSLLGLSWWYVHSFPYRIDDEPKYLKTKAEAIEAAWKLVDDLKSKKRSNTCQVLKRSK